MPPTDIIHQDVPPTPSPPRENEPSGVWLNAIREALGRYEAAPEAEIDIDPDTLQSAVAEYPAFLGIGGTTQTAVLPPMPPTRIGGKGWIEIKRFGKNKQRAYRYIRWREGRVKRSLYDGKAL